MGKGDALLIDSTELDGGRRPSSSGAVARSPPLLACMNEPAAIHLTDRVRAAYKGLHGAHGDGHTGLDYSISITKVWLRAFRRKNVEPREQCDAAEDSEDDAHDCVVWL